MMPKNTCPRLKRGWHLRSPGRRHDGTGAADAKFLQIAEAWRRWRWPASRTAPGLRHFGGGRSMQKRRQSAGLFTGLSIAGLILAGLGLALGLLLGACAHN